MIKREKEVRSAKEMADAIIVLHNWYLPIYNRDEADAKKYPLEFLKIHLNSQKDNNGKVDVSIHIRDSEANEIGEQKTELTVTIPANELSNFLEFYEGVRMHTIISGSDRSNVYLLKEFFGKYKSYYFNG